MASAPICHRTPRIAIGDQSPLGSAVVRILDASGIAQSRVTGETLNSGAWDLFIAIDPMPESAAQMARCAYRLGVASLFAALEGDVVRIGPLVPPGGRPCRDCSVGRLGLDSPAAAISDSDPGIEAAARRIAAEAMHALECAAFSPLAGHVIFLDTTAGSESRHRIVPLPWCDTCGGAEGLLPEAPPLFPRGLSGADLRTRLAGWLDPRTGIVSHLMVSGADGENGVLPFCAVAVTGGVSVPAFGYGKGLAEPEAMIGAFAEAMEQYAAARIPAGALCHAALDRLDAPAFDPRELCLYADAQYRRVDFPFRPFDPSAPVAWTPGFWLDSREPLWLPAAAVYLSSQLCDGGQFCQATSNGLAAGETFEQAALHAVLELVERDALMLTWLGERPARRVILDEPVEQGIQDILTRLERRCASVELYLLHTGIDIPVALCVAFGGGSAWPGATVGSGAHLSPRMALRKAILEQGQTGPYHARLWAERSAAIPRRDTDVRAFSQHALYYLPPERACAFDFLRAGADRCFYSTLDEPAAAGLPDCLARLAAAGLRVAAADITPPDLALLPMRVVRALAPRLQPIHCGFGMERLDNPRLYALRHINRHIHPFC